MVYHLYTTVHRQPPARDDLLRNTNHRLDRPPSLPHIVQRRTTTPHARRNEQLGARGTDGLGSLGPSAGGAIEAGGGARGGRVGAVGAWKTGGAIDDVGAGLAVEGTEGCGGAADVGDVGALMVGGVC